MRTSLSRCPASPPQGPWVALVANAEFYLNDPQNESFPEQLRERVRLFEEKGWERVRNRGTIWCCCPHISADSQAAAARPTPTQPQRRRKVRCAEVYPPSPTFPCPRGF